MRPPSSVAMATWKPRPSSCNSLSRATSAPSTTMSAVEEELSPSFSSSRVTRTSAASRMNAETPRAPGVSGSVRAKRTKVPACEPFVIHCLAPVMRQPSPSGTAAVRSAPASEPASGSVSAKAPISSPRASGGTKRARCSSVPNWSSGSVQALVCTATVTPTPASARESSSSTSTYERKSAPAPPYSSGTQTPMKPSPASLPNSSRGKPCARSHSEAFGSISACANSRASAWISRWSSVRSNLIGRRVYGRWRMCQAPSPIVGSGLASGTAQGTLPWSWYSDPELLRHEQEHIFRRGWQYAGPVEHAAQPGDFFTCSVGDVPVVVTRDAAGELHALLNVCRHRGSIVAQGSGNRATLQCPYHAWTYELDGRLRAAPRAGEIDVAAVAVLALAVETWGPVVFVNPDPAPAPLEDVLGPVPQLRRGGGIELERVR